MWWTIFLYYWLSTQGNIQTCFSYSGKNSGPKRGLLKASYYLQNHFIWQKKKEWSSQKNSVYILKLWEELEEGVKYNQHTPKKKKLKKFNKFSNSQPMVYSLKWSNKQAQGKCSAQGKRPRRNPSQGDSLSVPSRPSRLPSPAFTNLPSFLLSSHSLFCSCSEFLSNQPAQDIHRKYSLSTKTKQKENIFKQKRPNSFWGQD